MTYSSWPEGREALGAIFGALARRLGARAEGARVVRADGSIALALEDATRVPDARWLAGLALTAHGAEQGWLRAVLVARTGTVFAEKGLRHARAAVDDWGSIAHCTIARFLRRTPSWGFPVASMVRTRDPLHTLALAASGEVDIAAVDVATLAVRRSARVEVIAIGPALPGRVWIGEPAALPALHWVFRDRALGDARATLGWAGLVEPSARARRQARQEALAISPPPAPGLVPARRANEQGAHVLQAIA